MNKITLELTKRDAFDLNTMYFKIPKLYTYGR